VTEFADWALTLLDLGRGQVDDACRSARDISATLVVQWSGLDRIEAAIRAGHEEAAREWLASFDAWADGAGIAWGHAVSLHCHGLLCEDPDETRRCFEEALARHAEAARPFEQARTELAYGEVLRRAGTESTHASTCPPRSTGSNGWVRATGPSGHVRSCGRAARQHDVATRAHVTSSRPRRSRSPASSPRV
jgi:hypothetical protein